MNEDEKDYVLFLLTILAKKSTFSHDQEASLKYLYSLCLGIVTYCAVLVNCAKYIKY